MATRSSVLAWRIPGTGESGGLPSVGSHRVGHDWRDLAAAAAVSEVKVTQSCKPMVLVSLPGSSVRGILQARILEWVAVPFSRGSSQPRDGTRISHTAGGFFINCATSLHDYLFFTHLLIFWLERDNAMGVSKLFNLFPAISWCLEHIVKCSKNIECVEWMSEWMSWLKYL